MSIRRLPFEITAYIAGYLEPGDVFNFSATCHHFRFLTLEHTVCKAALEVNYSPENTPSPLPPSPPISYPHRFTTPSYSPMYGVTDERAPRQTRPRPLNSSRHGKIETMPGRYGD